jgi:hypothetical protein
MSVRLREPFFNYCGFTLIYASVDLCLSTLLEEAHVCYIRSKLRLLSHSDLENKAKYMQ